MDNWIVGCNHDDREEFLDLGYTPLADAFPRDPRDVQPRYPLRAEFCPRCYVVQLSDDSVAPESALFGDDYAFFSGSSPSLVEHFANYAAWVKDLLPPHDEVVEIACNDGTLLQHFVGWAESVCGVDPAGPPTAQAREYGLHVDTSYFTSRWAENYVAGSPASVKRLVVANNVIAHVPDLRDFVAGLALLVGDDGVGILEFQYLGDLVTGNQFDLIYHEHRRYLSLTTLMNALVEFDLQLVANWYVDTQGGSVRALVARGDQRGTYVGALAAWRDEEWLRQPETLRAVKHRVHRVIDQVRTAVEREYLLDRRVALYGAPAKATTLLHACDLTDNKMINYAVDLTPYKIGRYLPGTNVEIITPDEERERGRADTYLLSIPNYVSGILRREREFFYDGGRFIVPLPKPVVL